MIVSKSSYQRLERELNNALFALAQTKKELFAHQVAYKRITTQWNELVERINAKGGEDFLDRGVINGASQFTPAELQKLILLCHPDKHGGKPMANEMTQKLLAMKNQQ